MSGSRRWRVWHIDGETYGVWWFWSEYAVVYDWLLMSMMEWGSGIKRHVVVGGGGGEASKTVNVAHGTVEVR